jgi:hypothetical protein
MMRQLAVLPLTVPVILHGTRSVNANGKNFEETFTCTYDINPDGTGSANCKFSVFGPTSLDLILLDDGDEFYFNVIDMTNTNGKPVLQGVGKRQSPGRNRNDH